MKLALLFFAIFVSIGFSQIEVEIKIIPIIEWPKVLNLTDKQIVNPSKIQCIKEGYRILIPRPANPSGKRIKSETIVQDNKDIAKCKYAIIYEDIPIAPTPIPYVPEVWTSIPYDKVSFQFTTNGQYRGVIWKDAPKTNAVK